MKSDSERCAEHEKIRKINAAFRAGDLVALRASVDDPDIVPNGPMPLAIGPCLEYAIYHSPLPFIRTCLKTAPIPTRQIMPGSRRSSRRCRAVTHTRELLDVRTWLNLSNCYSRSEQIRINAV